MTAPSRAREGEPIYFGAPPGRKYIDELPADAHFAPGAKDVFEAPSVTTILKAGLPTSWQIRKWDRETVASYAVDNAAAWANLRQPDGSFDRRAAVDTIMGAADRSLGRASSRGTDVHAVFESLGKGQPIPAIGPGREPWVRAVQQFWSDFRPVPVLVECTVYKRGRAPYAGTPDLIGYLPTGPSNSWELWDVDLKTGKDVYGNMAYQQVAYLDADYAIGHVEGQSDTRIAIPEVERIGILNAREDGTYDLVELCETGGLPDPDKRAHALAVFYKAYGVWEDLKLERGLRGRNIPVPGALEVALYASWLMQRGKALFAQGPHAIGLITSMWPKGVAGFTNPEQWTDAQCKVIDERLSFIEAELGMQFMPPPRERTAPVVKPGADLVGEAPPDGMPNAFAGLPTYQLPTPTGAVTVGPLEGDATGVAEALRLKRLGEDFGPGPIADMPARHASTVDALWEHPDTQAAIARGAALYEPPAEPDPAEQAMLEALRQRLHQPDPGEQDMPSALQLEVEVGAAEARVALEAKVGEVVQRELQVVLEHPALANEATYLRQLHPDGVGEVDAATYLEQFRSRYGAMPSEWAQAQQLPAVERPPAGQASPHPFVEAIDGQTGAGLGVCVCQLDLDAPVHGGYTPEPVNALGRLAAAAGEGTADQLPAVSPWAEGAIVGRPHHAGRWLTGEEEAQVRQRGSFTLDGQEVTPSFTTSDAPGSDYRDDPSFRAQLARLAAAGVGDKASAPGPEPSPETGLTQREAELFAQHRGAVLDAVAELPVDLQRQLNAWSQAEGIGNVKSLPVTPDGLRKMELAHIRVGEAQREHAQRVERLTKVLEVMLPLPLVHEPMPEDGRPVAAGNLWGWLQMIAATGDGHLPDQEGGPWEPDGLEGTHCVIVEALARALTSMVLFIAPVHPIEPEAADTAVVPLKLHVNLELAKKLGKGIGDARAVITAAKSQALELGLSLRPTTQQQVYADPILVALLQAMQS